MSNTSEKYYSDLDEITLFNWERLLRGELEYICHKKPKQITEAMGLAFENLYNKYLLQYGTHAEFLEYVAVKRNLIELRLVFVQTGDKFILNQIEIEERNLEKMMNDQEGGMTIAESLVILGKFFGRWIDKRDITVEGFESLKKEYGRANKKG